MIFQWLNFPTLFVGTIFGPIAFFWFKLLIADGYIRVSKGVDLFQIIIWIASTSVSQTYLRLAGILSKQKTTKIWEELPAVLNEIHENGDESVETFLEGQLKRQRRKMGLAYLATFACIAVFFKTSVIPLIRNVRFGALYMIWITLWSPHEIFSITKNLG
jgi:hypothetical protein